MNHDLTVDAGAVDRHDAAFATSSGALGGAARARSARAAPRHHQRWTDEELDTLRWEWGVRTPAAIGKALGRRASAVVRMAERMGLGTGRPRGLEYVSEAASRTGFSRRQLALVLDYAGVRRRRPSSRRTGKNPAHRVVDPVEVDAAIALWLTTGTISEAAERHGVSRFVLERLVLADPRTPPRNGKHRLRVPWALLDEIAATVDGARLRRKWRKHEQAIK